MGPQIKILPAKRLIGNRIKMSLSDNLTNKTFELWRSFMPRRREIKNSVGADLYCMQIYDKTPDFKNCDPDAVFFEKWAAIEVSDFETVPPGMWAHQLAGGTYAVFIHRGTPADFRKTLQYIYGDWFPGSGYVLDDREHFELLGEKYISNDPASEEEIWVPVRSKE